MGKVSGFFLKTLTPGVLAGSLIAVKYAKDARQSKERIRRDYLLYAEWLKMKQKGEPPGAYLRQNGWRRVAIYGMGAVGIRLYEELRGSGTEISYVIDRRPRYVYSGLRVCDLNGELEAVDAVIVSLQSDYETIRKQLEEKIQAPIVSVKDVIFKSCDIQGPVAGREAQAQGTNRKEDEAC